MAEHLVGKPAQASFVAVVPLIARPDNADANAEHINPDDLLKVGTAARVVQVSRAPQVCSHIANHTYVQHHLCSMVSGASRWRACAACTSAA